MEDYLWFLAKGVTLVFLVALLVGAVAGALRQTRPEPEGNLRVRRYNDHYRRMTRAIDEAVAPPRTLRQKWRWRREALQAERPSPEAPRTFVLRFEGDLRASQVERLREEISAILSRARPETDQVVLILDSPGGLVPGYGLAAAQLTRLRDAGLPLTVAVDRVAASGGYLMAAVADRLVAAPFAIVGSIGVVAQIPNVHRLLKRHDVDIELMTAGEHKRTLTVLGENTEAGRRKFQEDLEQTHALFKEFLARYRPQLNLDQVATGEYWHAEQALALWLVDEIAVSDDLLRDLCANGETYEVHYHRKQRLHKRLAVSLQTVLDRLMGTARP
ncbi:MAG: protease SohB [Halothiobacillaceae bacterium]